MADTWPVASRCRFSLRVLSPHPRPRRSPGAPPVGNKEVRLRLSGPAVCCLPFALRSLRLASVVRVLLLLAGVERNPGPVDDVVLPWLVASSGRRKKKRAAPQSEGSKPAAGLLNAGQLGAIVHQVTASVIAQLGGAAPSPPAKKLPHVCRGHLAGRCDRGASCKFQHPAPATTPAVAAAPSRVRERDEQEPRNAARRDRRGALAAAAPAAPATTPPSTTPPSATSATPATYSAVAASAAVRAALDGDEDAPLLRATLAVELAPAAAARLIAKSVKLEGEATAQLATCFAAALEELANRAANFFRGVRRLSSWSCRVCAFVASSAATVAGHHARVHSAPHLAPLRLAAPGLPNLGHSCSLSACVALLAASLPVVTFGGALAAAVVAPSASTATALAAAIQLDVTVPSSPAAIMFTLLAMLGTNEVSRMEQADCCSSCGHQEVTELDPIIAVPRMEVPLPLAALSTLTELQRLGSFSSCSGTAAKPHALAPRQRLLKVGMADVLFIGLSPGSCGLAAVPEATVWFNGSEYRCVALLCVIADHAVVFVAPRPPVAGRHWSKIDEDTATSVTGAELPLKDVCLLAFRLVSAAHSSEEPVRLPPLVASRWQWGPCSGRNEGSGLAADLDAVAASVALPPAAVAEPDIPTVPLLPGEMSTTAVESVLRGLSVGEGVRVSFCSRAAPAAAPLIWTGSVVTSWVAVACCVEVLWDRDCPGLRGRRRAALPEADLPDPAWAYLAIERIAPAPAPPLPPAPLPPPPAVVDAAPSDAAGAACTCPNRGPKAKGRHRAGCPCSHPSLAGPAAPSLAAPPSAADAIAAAEDAILASQAPAPTDQLGPAPFALPSLDEIAALGTPIIPIVPRSALPGVSSALCSLLGALSATDPTPWVRLALFVRCVLACPARRGTALSAAIRRRLARWHSGHVGELWEEVRLHKREPAVAGTALPPESWLPLPREGQHLAGTAATDANVRRCLFWARQGAASRAVACLSATAPAAETPETLEALAALHPASPPFVVPPLAGPEFAPAAATLGEVRAALRSFSRFSAGGLSLLTPRILVACSEVPGSQIVPSLVRAADLFLAGLIPVAARPFFFGARLTALKKPAGGVRPIACGDVLRRLASKILAARSKSALASFFGPHLQVGVAIPGGADVAVALARGCLADPSLAVLKVDFKNAFNTVDRGAVLHAVARHFPSWSPLVAAAYVAPSWLFFGPHCLPSAGGVQQGDVLGPALFSLVLAAVVERARAAAPPLRAEVWYLDDGFLAGPAAAVASFADSLEVEAGSVGLVLNRAKCEQFGPAPFVTGVPHRSPSEFVLLGVPAGPRPDAEAWCAEVGQRIAARAAAIAALPDTHIALVLLRACGVFPMAGFALRAVGPCAAWPALDLALRSCAETIVGPLPDASWAIAQLPLSRGGLGLRCTAPFAALALAAASCAAAPRVRFWWPSAGPDPVASWLPSSSIPASLCGPVVAALQVWSEPVPAECPKVVPRLQKPWSDVVVEEAAALVVAALPDAASRAIHAAHAAPSASGWLAPAPLPDASQLQLEFFSPAETLVLVRRRLCLPALDPSADVLCPLCTRVAVSDAHMLSCMSGGLRKRLSDSVVDVIAAVLRGGGSAVTKEPACFPDAPSLRADLLFRLSGPRAIAADVAVTHAHEGSPDAYLPTKVGKYGALAASAGLRFLPVVFDTAGGCSTEALSVLRAAAARWGRRHDVHPAYAVHLALATINRTLMRGVAALLLRGLAVLPPPGGG